MTPEEILKQQSKIARAARVENKSSPLINPDAIVAGYDADLGQNIIQLSDGSIRYADALTNGSVGVGDPILLHQGMGTAHIDDLPHIKKRPVTNKPKVLTTYPFKILFSVVENGVRKFYVGGDRPNPTLIYQVDASHIIYEATITNLGAKKNDWVVGIKSAHSPVGDTISRFYSRYTFDLAIINFNNTHIHTSAERLFYPGEYAIETLYLSPALKAAKHHGGGFFSTGFLWLAQYRGIQEVQNDWYAHGTQFDPWTSVYSQTAFWDNEIKANESAETTILPDLNSPALPILTNKNLPAFSCDSTLIASSDLQYAIALNSAYSVVPYRADYQFPVAVSTSLRIDRAFEFSRIVIGALNNTYNQYFFLHGRYFNLSDYGINYPSEYYLFKRTGEKKIINFNNSIPIINPRIANLVAKNDSLTLYVSSEAFSSATSSNTNLEVKAYPFILGGNSVTLGESTTIQGKVLSARSPTAEIHSISYYPPK